jgi:hypothetical protein
MFKIGGNGGKYKIIFCRISDENAIVFGME